jgi:glycolate oxidase
MALPKDTYSAFQDIVGKDHISEDPALLDSYAVPMSQTASHLGPFYKVRPPRAQAVLLPGSTAEVQAIVRLCNKYKIKFKASSTFWSSMGNTSDDNAIQLDMRRMDRILEINAKNQFAVIEPYVIGATLQAEAMKVGLNALIIGAGSSCSPLASASGWAGVGPGSLFMGSNTENVLGYEWVLPNGDLLTTGSAGSGLGWFCGEGPGPSVRGLLRGGLGAIGALGVCTKCALKLSPWPGPPRLHTEGTIPAYKAVLPDNIRVYTLCFPSWSAWADCVIKICDSDIGYIGHRQYNMFGCDLKGAMLRILTDPAKTLSDLEDLLKDPKVKQQTEEMKIDFQFILAGMTQRDIEYQEKVLGRLLSDTGGWKAAMTEEPDIKSWSLLYLIRLGHKNLNFVYAGGYEGNFGLVGVPEFGASHVAEAAAFKRKWEQEHTAIAAVGGDSAMLAIAGQGGGGGAQWEFFNHFDSHDRESTEGTCAFFDATASLSREKGWGADMGRYCSDARGPDGYGLSKEQQEAILSRSPNPLLWNYQWKVREALDPNHLGDSYYRTLEPVKT